MAQTKQVPKDQYLVREGDSPVEMYIIKSGSFTLTQFRGQTEHHYKDFHSGEMFGEIGLFRKRPSEFNIKALQDSEVITMPFETLHKQIEALPTWIQALLKNLIAHLQESLHFINTNLATNKTPTQSPHQLTKYLAILNFVSLRHDHVFDLASLRNYTIQMFQEATAPMNTLSHTLADLGYLQATDTNNGPGYKNLKPEALLHFLEWYNEWLFKPERNRLSPLVSEEVENLKAILRFAKDLPTNHKGFTKVNLNSLHTESEIKIGRAIRKEALLSLTAKKYFAEPTMEDSGVVIYLPCDELEVLAENWALVHSLIELF